MKNLVKCSIFINNLHRHDKLQLTVEYIKLSHSGRVIDDTELKSMKIDDQQL